MDFSRIEQILLDIPSKQRFSILKAKQSRGKGKKKKKVNLDGQKGRRSPSWHHFRAEFKMGFVYLGCPIDAQDDDDDYEQRR
jgi:hypothetical protein